MSRVLWILVLLYALARITQAFPDRIPMIAIVAMYVVPALCFAFVHGALLYGWRVTLAFASCCAVIGNLSENLSIATGFPFGRYHFTDVMGPKLLHVPILLGLAYIGIGYISWVLALIILGARWRPFATPLAASFIMVAWDLSMDPIWANIVHAWVWHGGGSYFGVPVSNFLGWFLTVFLIYQAFSRWSARLPHRANCVLPVQYARPAIAFYTVSASGNLFVAHPPESLIRDATGIPWPVEGIFAASALVSIFLMGAFAALAWVRTAR